MATVQPRYLIGKIDQDYRPKFIRRRRRRAKTGVVDWQHHCRNTRKTAKFARLDPIFKLRQNNQNPFSSRKRLEKLGQFNKQIPFSEHQPSGSVQFSAEKNITANDIEVTEQIIRNKARGILQTSKSAFLTNMVTMDCGGLLGTNLAYKMRRFLAMQNRQFISRQNQSSYV